MRTRLKTQLFEHVPVLSRRFLSAALLAIFIATLASGCADPERQKIKHYRKGLILAQRGRCGEAITEYQEALKIDPRMAQAQFELGKCYAELRYDDLAVSALEAAKNIDPGFAVDALAQIAEIHAAGGRSPMAEEVCREILVIDSRNIEAMLFLGDLKREDGDIEGAKSWLEKALLVDADRIEPRIALADIATEEGDFEEAERHLEKIMTGIDPNHPGAGLALAKVYRYSGRTNEAVELLRKILDRNPANVAARGALAESYLSEDRLDEARAEAEAFLKGAPANAEAHFLLGAILLRQEDYGKAAFHLTEAANSTSATARSHYLLGLALRESNKLAQAISAFRNALAEQPGDSSYRLALAQALLREGAFDEAQREIRMVLDGEPDNEHAQQMWARSAGLKQAFEHIDALLASEMASEQAAESIKEGLRAFRAGDLEKTQAICEGLLRDAPESPVPLNLLGLVHLKRNDFERALAHFRRATRVDPEFAASHINMANVFLAIGSYEQALQAGRKAVELAPKDQIIRLGYIRALRLTNQTDEAENFMRTLIEREPSQMAHRMGLAGVLISRNEYAAARKELSQILEQDPKHLPAANLFAETLAKEGDAEGAAARFEALLKEHPDAWNIRAKLTLCRLALGSITKARETHSADPSKDEESHGGDLGLALILQGEGRHEDAESALLSIRSGSPRELPFELMLAGVRAIEEGGGPFVEPAGEGARQSDAFRKSYEKLLQGDDIGAPEIYELNLGIGLSQVRWRRLGIARLENILRKTGPNPALLELVGGLWEKEGQPEKATESYRSAAAADPSYWPAHYQLGEQAFASNRPDEAERHYLEARKYQPDSSAILLGLAQVYETTGIDDAAIEIYREIGELHPNLASVMNNLAWLLSKNPDTIDEALEYATRAATSQPYRAETHDTLGWIYFQKRDYRNAGTHFDKAVLFNAIDPSIRYHRGMLFYKSGDGDRALEEFRQAEASTSSFPEKELNNEMISKLS